MFRLNDLRHFVEIAHCSSFAEGSRRVNITLAALSESIRRLESDLNCVLFYRTRTGVKLTPTGRTVFEESHRMLAAMKRVEASTRPNDSTAPLKISLGAHPLVASYALPGALSTLTKNFPGLSIDIHHGLSREMQAEVQKGAIDLALVVNPAGARDIVIQTLAKDDVTVWRASSTRAIPERLLCDPELFQTQEVLRKWKKAPSIQTSSGSIELLARLTASGIGFGILPGRVVSLLNLELKRVPGAPSVEDRICLVRRPEFGKLLVEKALVDALKQALT